MTPWSLRGPPEVNERIGRRSAPSVALAEGGLDNGRVPAMGMTETGTQLDGPASPASVPLQERRLPWL